MFGPTIRISTGAEVPTRLICEQHIIEDLGWIPSLKDWFKCLQPKPWMMAKAKLLFQRSYTLTPEHADVDTAALSSVRAHAADLEASW
ncbi:MAG: hypothetical protein NZ482_03735 [Gloeomargarita sp. SKYG98]|nr:hypothetical protein [Gloeomargarita sp. SKYG98]